MASSPKGTKRSLLPLPVTRSTPCCRLISVNCKPTNSDTRKPVAYKTSNKTRSRNPKSVVVSGASNNDSTSSSVNVLGNERPSFGASIKATGSTSIFFSRNK